MRFIVIVKPPSEPIANIELPPSSEVFDATPLLQRALDQLSG